MLLRRSADHRKNHLALRDLPCETARVAQLVWQVGKRGECVSRLRLCLSGKHNSGCNPKTRCASLRRDTHLCSWAYPAGDEAFLALGGEKSVEICLEVCLTKLVKEDVLNGDVVFANLGDELTFIHGVFRVRVVCVGSCCGSVARAVYALIVQRMRHIASSVWV